MLYSLQEFNHAWDEIHWLSIFMNCLLCKELTLNLHWKPFRKKISHSTTACMAFLFIRDYIQLQNVSVLEADSSSESSIILAVTHVSGIQKFPVSKNQPVKLSPCGGINASYEANNTYLVSVSLEQHFSNKIKTEGHMQHFSGFNRTQAGIGRWTR